MRLYAICLLVMRASWVPLLLAGALAGCGGRTAIIVGDAIDAGGGPSAERCNLLDDDGDGKVDEIYRDAQGRYVHDEHCGRCGHSCGERIQNAAAQGCGLLGEMPACVAFECAPGFGLSQSGSCVTLDDRICLACQGDDDCGPLAGAACIEVGGEKRCTRPCGAGCPDGYVCASEQCVPEGSSCNCSGTSDRFEVACRPPGAKGDCTGRARCENGALSQCASPAERCNGEDDDCDGKADEGFVDERGAYSLDDQNCGACGVDCGVDTPVTGLGKIQLTCGGDPFAPTCVTRCPDALDGVQPGDQLDADRQLENGCECEVRAVRDDSGAAGSEGQLDANCDGADGDVTSSFYVSVDGDDSGPGSPTRPLRSINTAITRAVASLDTDHPRPHVYVAAGVYTETVRLRDGVLLHGGYRSDFLAQSASGFEVIVVAPADTRAPFGAALVAERTGRLPTVVEGMRFRGRDALDPGGAAVGAVIDNGGANLVLRALEITSGHPGAGAAGAEGEAGDTPLMEARAGSAPRGALESSDHLCFSGDSNTAHGGAGGVSMCNGNVNVSGGPGGSAVCPVAREFAGTGATGRSAAGGNGGPGGNGGQDVIGPIVRGDSCSQDICCGLADFSVAGDLAYPQAGMPGGDGRSGNAGSACSDPLGAFNAASWNPGAASPGGSGGPGGGGGGGGAGGGAEINWTAVACQFADGIGGGGGGGGGGGCGGLGGGAGQAGGIALALLVRGTRVAALPTIQNVSLMAADAGNGGDGGAGGDGGLGGGGGLGGDIENALRSTPTLAGVMSGQRGGKGGNGGAGGGGGGGCGGSSVGIWITGVAQDNALVQRLTNANSFELGAAGQGGRGGGGPFPAAAGSAGTALNVVLR